MLALWRSLWLAWRSLAMKTESWPFCSLASAKCAGLTSVVWRQSLPPWQLRSSCLTLLALISEEGWQPPVAWLPVQYEKISCGESYEKQLKSAKGVKAQLKAQLA